MVLIFVVGGKRKILTATLKSFHPSFHSVSAGEGVEKVAVDYRLDGVKERTVSDAIGSRITDSLEMCWKLVWSRDSIAYNVILDICTKITNTCKIQHIKKRTNRTPNICTCRRRQHRHPATTYLGTSSNSKSSKICDADLFQSAFPVTSKQRIDSQGTGSSISSTRRRLLELCVLDDIGVIVENENVDSDSEDETEALSSPFFASAACTIADGN